MKMPFPDGLARKGVTLVELLVVMAIITLLISLTLPALENARRQARVVTCMATLRSIGIGIGAYVAENDGQYPTPSCINGGWVTSPHARVDNRQVLVDMVQSVSEAWFCALAGDSRDTPFYPHELHYWDDPTVEFGKHFYLADTDSPGTSFLLPFIIIDRAVHGYGLPWDWSHSGNADGPWFPGDSNAISVFDPNFSLNNNTSPPLTAAWSSHAGLIFKEGNSLWGDGHVKSRQQPLNYIKRVSPLSVSIY